MKLNEAILNQLAVIKLYEKKADSLYWAVSWSFSSYYYSNSEEAKKAYATLHYIIYEKLLEAYRHLLLLAFNKTEVDPELRKKVKDKVYDYFFNESKGGIKKSMGSYLSEDGLYPGAWSIKEEEELREYIKKSYEEDEK